MDKQKPIPNQKHDWHQADIIAALKKQGTNLTQVAKAAGYSNAGTLWNALARKWPKGERIIATAIGVEPNVIWPSRYLRTEKVYPKKTFRNDISTNDCVNAQKTQKTQNTQKEVA
ncbi:transcriptional regulator [Shewanella xiamenensis]|uniref:helix-turn-helix domain-containing protein n=1 Tax=Shewanella xiamenensis TaxID=332186 RepID=UPI00313AE5F2